MKKITPPVEYVIELDGTEVKHTEKEKTIYFDKIHAMDRAVVKVADLDKLIDGLVELRKEINGQDK